MIIAGGQGALLQGMRRIAYIARVSVLGGLMGTVIAVVMVYCYGEKGIAPSMIIVAACSMIVSWWYSRKLNIRVHAVSPANLLAESTVLFKLGLAFLGSALLMQGAAYAVRIIILRIAGLEAAGVYQAAWTLGGLYIGFILNAMGTDFYPRLVGVAQNNAECNRMVNEQAHVSLLLALPGVLGTIVFAPIVISLFYSSKFSASVEVLRWICLGMGVRVLIYPLGYIVVAKNLRVLFIAMDATWVVVNLILTYWWVSVLGAAGAGMAYTAAYVLHGVIVCLLVRRVSGFRWDAPVRQTAFLFVAMSVGVFLTSTKLPTLAAVLVGVLAVTGAIIYSARSLLILVEPEHLPARLHHLFTLMSRLCYGKRTVQ
jgi:PST family polysaccharide transporter